MLRLFKLNTGQDDHAVMFLDDYLKQVGLIVYPNSILGLTHSYKIGLQDENCPHLIHILTGCLSSDVRLLTHMSLAQG